MKTTINLAQQHLFSPWTLCHNSPNPSFRTSFASRSEIRNPVKGQYNHILFWIPARIHRRRTWPGWRIATQHLKGKRTFCGVLCIGVFMNYPGWGQKWKNISHTSVLFFPVDLTSHNSPLLLLVHAPKWCWSRAEALYSLSCRIE